jgi:hypothetical protein
VLDVPDMLRPFLRAWWEREGRPVAGPVFPVRKGKRAGEKRGPRISHARRLRHALARAGVFRLPPVKAPATSPGTRTDLGRAAAGTKLVPNPRDPLYFETPVSLPVDFHSFRRAFNTALAVAGVNVQKAMRLAGHSDAKTHMRYVKDAPEMRQIPDAALPRLHRGPKGAKSRRAPANHRKSRGGAKRGEDDANSAKTSVLRVRSPASKPLVGGSSPSGRAADPELSEEERLARREPREEPGDERHERRRRSLGLEEDRSRPRTNPVENSRVVRSCNGRAPT